MVFGLFKNKEEEQNLHTLYLSLVEQARRPEFYTELSVPDTIDGRYDLIALHMFLVLRRLKTEHERTHRFSQKLFDVMFSDMDLSLREMGVADLGIGPRIKKMAKAFYGRVTVYEKALSDGEAELADALSRNLYGTIEVTPEVAVKMSRYVVKAASSLDSQAIDALILGKIDFVDPMDSE